MDDSKSVESVVNTREKNIQEFITAMNEKHGSDSWSSGIRGIIDRFESGTYADRIPAHVAEAYVEGLKGVLPKIEAAEQSGASLRDLKREVAELQLNSNELAIIEEELHG